MPTPIVVVKVKYQDREHQIEGTAKEDQGYLVIKKDGEENGKYQLDMVEYWSNQQKD